MFENSGNPASKVQCTIDQWFDISKPDAGGPRPRTLGQSPAGGVKDFIIAPRDTGRMLFYDEDDGRSEKDCMWEEY